MTILRKATVLFAAFVFISPAMAQDHSMHAMSHSVHAQEVKPHHQASSPMCAGMKGHTMGEGMVPQTQAEKASAKAMAAMHENMAKPYTGDPDADFIRGMIPHHQGAVEMARIVLKYGDDEAAKDLARRIIVAQKGEIAWMQRWLRQRQIPENGAFHFNH